MTVAENDSAGSELGTNTRRANVLLRQARLRTPSPADPARPMSQRELAEALTAHVFDNTTRVVPLDRHFVSRVERGVRRYPTDDYRAAFRAVLGAATDAELGFVRPRCASRQRPSLRSTIRTPVARALQSLPEGTVTQLVVPPGMTVVVLPTDHPALEALAVERQR